MVQFYLIQVLFGIICFLSQGKSRNSRQLNRTLKEKLYQHIKDICEVSLSAQLMILPILVYNYHTISLTFLISNVLTFYLIGIIIIYGFLLIFISFPFLKLAKLLGIGLKLLINIFLNIIRFTAKIPLSKIYIITPYLWQILLYYLAIFSFLYFYHKFRNKSNFTKFKKIINKTKN